MAICAGRRPALSRRIYNGKETDGDEGDSVGRWDFPRWLNRGWLDRRAGGSAGRSRADDSRIAGRRPGVCRSDRSQRRSSVPNRRADSFEKISIISWFFSPSLRSAWPRRPRVGPTPPVWKNAYWIAAMRASPARDRGAPLADSQRLGG